MSSADITVQQFKANLAGDVERVEDIDGKAATTTPFTPEEEKKYLRKIDLCYDKGVMSAATQFGFSTDLKLTEIIGHEKNGTPITDNKKYANASMMFYIGYLIGTYPMMYLTQRFSISRVVASATLLWGAVLMSTAACYNYPGIMVNRLFLGILESAVAPSFTVLVTFWWTREEQALRTSLWYACVGVATMVSPLINYGLGQTHGSLPSWKPMFLILGAVTILWSAVLFFCLPDNPMTSRRLTDAEKEIAKYRLQRNNAGAISHEFNKAQWRNTRYICIVICASISIGGALICWLGPRDNKGLLFAGIFLVAIQVASGGLAVSLSASNISGHTKKSTASASTFVGYCVGNVIGPVIFGASPGPGYRAGFTGSCICLCGVVVIATATCFLLRRENTKRDKRTGRHSDILHDVDEDTTDMQKMDFRYVL
ncbi:hypothetical protein FPRO06_06112 [Fusarium proliferatum]|nr:hypothetical protein FPRO06_06112 [Fusarium proliferatum]